MSDKKTPPSTVRIPPVSPKLARPQLGPPNSTALPPVSTAVPPITERPAILFGPPLSEGPPAYEGLPPPLPIRTGLTSQASTAQVLPANTQTVSVSQKSYSGPVLSRSGPTVSNQATGIAVPPSKVVPSGPPVPKRRDSLPLTSAGATPGPSSDAVKTPTSKVPANLTGSRSTYAPSASSLSTNASVSKKAKVPRRVLAQVRTQSQVETMLDEPHSTSYMFEAHNLCRESFSALYEFFENKQLCDIEVRVGKKKIACHKLVLACVSRYFKTMFTSQMAESRSPFITIQDIEESALEQLIKFAYTAKISLSTDNVQSLLYASSILQIETVAQACCEFMKTHLHPSNCIGVRNFAEQHGRVELMKKSDEFARDHFMSVVDCDEYLSMTPHHLESLIESDNLNVDAEAHVFESVMKWVNHDKENRKQHLAQLMSKIKLPLLPATYLVEKVYSEEIVKQDLVCRDYLDEAKCYRMSLAHVLPDVKICERMVPRKSCAGVIFCVGGRGASGDPFKSIECYDLRKDRWFPVAEMSSRRRHVGVVSIQGKLYAVGGHDGADHLNTGEVFDPLTNKWKPIASMSQQRRGIALACLGGPIYAIGGLDDSTCFNIVERYDPECDSWSFVQAMNFSRGGVAVATVKAGSEKGYLYAIGGNDGAASLESCERYDPHLNKWSLIAPMNKRRAGAGVAELNGQLYVVGGFDDNSPLDSVERYDPQTDTWTMVSRMSCPRGGVGVAALAGKLYAVGGHDGTNYLSSVEAYNAQSDSWRTIAQIGSCRAGAGIAVVACHSDDLKDITMVYMSPAGTRRKSKKPSPGTRVCCTVKCSIITHTSIIYNDDIANANVQSANDQTANVPSDNQSDNVQQAHVESDSDLLGNVISANIESGHSIESNGDQSASFRSANIQSADVDSDISQSANVQPDNFPSANNRSDNGQSAIVHSANTQPTNANASFSDATNAGTANITTNAIVNQTTNANDAANTNTGAASTQDHGHSEVGLHSSTEAFDHPDQG